MTMEKMPRSQKDEVIPEPPADYLENDQRYKDLVQEASQNYLQEEDADFLGREGYSWDKQKGLLDRQGAAVTMSTLVGPAGWGRVQEEAQNNFREQYQADAETYATREKTRVYNEPDLDPAYRSIEQEIGQKSYRDQKQSSELYPGISTEDRERLALAEQLNTSQAFWDKFASEYPEKAAAYAGQNRFLEKSLRTKERWAQEAQAAAAEKQRVRAEGDERRRQEILSSLRKTSEKQEVAPLEKPEHIEELEIVEPPVINKAERNTEIETMEVNTAEIEPTQESTIAEYPRRQPVFREYTQPKYESPRPPVIREKIPGRKNQKPSLFRRFWSFLTGRQ